MPVSKKRKQATLKQRYAADSREMRRKAIEKEIDDEYQAERGISFQDLINMVAYQEYVKNDYDKNMDEERE